VNASLPAPPTAAASGGPEPSRPKWYKLLLLDNRYPALHGLRVLAIISVVQYHVTWVLAGEQRVPLDRDFAESSLSIFFGMDLFFFLSGFLIGSILLRSLARQGTQDLRRFYLRRIFRTFPSYWVVLTFLAITRTLTVAQRAHLPAEYLYATNFMPLSREDVIMFWGWSLALEEQFYLTVPLLFFVLHHLKRDRDRIILLAVLFTAALGNRLYVFLAHRPWNDFALYGALYFRTFTRFDTLVAGILLAFVHQRYGDSVRRWLEHPFHRALLLMPSLGCLWILLQPWAFGRDQVQIVHVFAWGTLTSVMYFAWVLLLLNREGYIQRVLSYPWFRRIATLGYGVYLVHLPICDGVIVPAVHALHARRVPLAVLWPGALLTLFLMALALSYVMHVLIERPSLRLRELLAG
jgi:peptidoglycan/LPS O-acetylase OafA/YrhL